MGEQPYPADITDAQIDHIAHKRWGRSWGDDGAQEMRLWLWRQTDKCGKHSQSWYLERAVRVAEDARDKFTHAQASRTVENFTDVGRDPMGEPEGEE